MTIEFERIDLDQDEIVHERILFLQNDCAIFQKLNSIQSVLPKTWSNSCWIVPGIIQVADGVWNKLSVRFPGQPELYPR